MQRTCNTCSKSKDLTDFYISNKRTGRRERQCKRCRVDTRKTPERREYIRLWRKRKTEEGHYGTCSKCSQPLGRNEHSDRPNQPTGICSKCQNLDNHHGWKGGRTINQDGYVIIRYKPLKTMLEHRYVMQQHIGRELKADETVHHVNGVRTDNRLDNLELWVGAPTRGIRKDDAVAWAKEILERYNV